MPYFLQVLPALDPAVEASRVFKVFVNFRLDRRAILVTNVADMRLHVDIEAGYDNLNTDKNGVVTFMCT